MSKPSVVTTIVWTDTDKDMLLQIAERNGGVSMSAAVRRLIRQEAKRLGLVSPEIPTLSQPTREECSTL